MESNSKSSWAGIDVSKKHWDVALACQKRVHRFDANESGCQQLIDLLAMQNVAYVCVEATGGWEYHLVTALREQGLLVSIVNPRQVRDFARAQGQLAKTDSIDAQIIARYAMMMQPGPTEKPTENQAKLRALKARRRQVTDMLVQEKNRLTILPDEDARRSIEEAIDFHKRQLEALDKQIKQLMQVDPLFKKRLSLLVSVPGVGETTAAALMADLPELGTLNRREAARLAGLAPINRDSGTLRGRRMIGGGRSTVRKGLYMATLVATKHNPIIRKFYLQLQVRGKEKMVALTACMRKLLLILNAIIKENKPWKCTQTA